jgi:hypothetical protein
MINMQNHAKVHSIIGSKYEDRGRCTQGAGKHAKSCKLHDRRLPLM